MIKFTQITEKLKYPPKHRANLSTLHSIVISHVVENFKNTSTYKRKVVSALNSISYYVISGDTMPPGWDPVTPIESIHIMDDTTCISTINDLFLNPKDITWDVEEVDSHTEVKSVSSSVKTNGFVRTMPISNQSGTTAPTPKDHLYIRSPLIPQFDVNSPWLDVVKNGNHYTIYRTLPLIPTTQNEISVTTDVSIMGRNDLMKLFPNRFIQTRSSSMYEKHDGLTFDPILGIILPIDRFTEQQVRDNIVKYPHFYKLVRLVDGAITSFYANIEVDGVLYSTTDIWDKLPDSRKIPRTSEFIKEYVVRRYLLERDIGGIEHKYPIFGTLDPFLTLFTTPSDYAKLGYHDAEELARNCVKSRVSYLQSRNPVLRAVYSE